jgi:hypothetical protein
VPSNAVIDLDGGTVGYEVHFDTESLQAASDLLVSQGEQKAISYLEGIALDPLVDGMIPRHLRRHLKIRGRGMPQAILSRRSRTRITPAGVAAIRTALRKTRLAGRHDQKARMARKIRDASSRSKSFPVRVTRAEQGLVSAIRNELDAENYDLEKYPSEAETELRVGEEAEDSE